MVILDTRSEREYFTELGLPYRPRLTLEQFNVRMLDWQRSDDTLSTRIDQAINLELKTQFVECIHSLIESRDFSKFKKTQLFREETRQNIDCLLLIAIIGQYMTDGEIDWAKLRRLNHEAKDNGNIRVLQTAVSRQITKMVFRHLPKTDNANTNIDHKPDPLKRKDTVFFYDDGHATGDEGRGDIVERVLFPTTGKGEPHTPTKGPSFDWERIATERALKRIPDAIKNEWPGLPTTNSEDANARLHYVANLYRNLGRDQGRVLAAWVQAAKVEKRLPNVTGVDKLKAVKDRDAARLKSVAKTLDIDLESATELLGEAIAKTVTPTWWEQNN